MKRFSLLLACVFLPIVSANAQSKPGLHADIRAQIIRINEGSTNPAHVMLSFLLRNDSDVEQPVGAGTWRILVEDVELPDSSFIFGNGPMPPGGYTVLSPGQRYEFGKALPVTRYFPNAGKYRVSWRGKGFQSPTVIVAISVADFANVKSDREPPPTPAVRKLPSCEKVRGRKLVPRGKYGLHFAVPKRGFTLLGGKWDVDYVKYVVTPNQSTAVVELWFGGYAMDVSPDAVKRQSSTNVSMTELTTESAVGQGADARGKGLDFRGLSDGRYWRHFGVRYAGGAVYDVKDEKDAQLLDTVVDSACFTEYPRK